MTLKELIVMNWELLWVPAELYEHLCQFKQLRKDWGLEITLENPKRGDELGFSVFAHNASSIFFRASPAAVSPLPAPIAQLHTLLLSCKLR